MSERENVIGNKYGRLTVIADAEDYIVPSTGKHTRKVLCKCECGNKCIVGLGHLKGGKIKSCGCYYHESRTKHGSSGTRLYTIWRKMKTRCYDKKYKQYSDYGGRGIFVCEEWKNDFSAFKKWALANGYNDKLTIDRIDVNGNYEPNNCRWVDMKTQGNNRRNNLLITFNGETKTLTQWADSLNMYNSGLKRRLDVGWSLEDAMTKPSLRRRKNARA